MQPLLTLATLGVLCEESPIADEARANYCIDNASREVARLAWHRDWMGIGPTGTPIEIVAAPRDAVMVAEQVAARAYLNPRSVVGEGGIGPIGGDRFVEEFAKAFQPTEWELAILTGFRYNGIPPEGESTGAGGLSVINFEVRGAAPAAKDILLPDLDPRAGRWPFGTYGVDGFAYGQL